MFLTISKSFPRETYVDFVLVGMTFANWSVKRKARAGVVVAAASVLLGQEFILIINVHCNNLSETYFIADNYCWSLLCSRSKQSLLIFEWYLNVLLLLLLLFLFSRPATFLNTPVRHCSSDNQMRKIYQLKGSMKEPNISVYFFLSVHHSMVFCFRCSVYWWKGSVRFKCFKILLIKY